MSINESKLEELSNYSTRKQKNEWTKKWWNDFYIPMLEEGFFLPPLVSYDIFTSCYLNNITSNSGKQFKKLKYNTTNYKNLFDTIRQVALKSIRKTSEEEKEKLSFRLGKFFAKQISCRFMDNLDNKDNKINCNIFNAEEILDKEIDTLKEENSSLAFKNTWFKKVIRYRNNSELVSNFELIPFKGRERTFIDPFIGVYIQNDIEKKLERSNVYGKEKNAENKSMVIGEVGKFAKMDAGKLPEEIDRLSPTDLLLLYKGINNKTIKRNTLQNVCHKYFLLKASNGELWQKYSSRIANSHTMPSVIVQLDFLDEIDFHRISNPPLPPRVSFYRSLIINLITQLIDTSKKFKWSLNLLINHRLFNVTETIFISDENLSKFGKNRENCLNYLISQLPAIFISGLPVNTTNITFSNEIVEYSLWARIVLGEYQSSLLKEKALEIAANDEIGIRVECSANGCVQLRDSYSAIEAEQIFLDEKDNIETPIEKNKAEYVALLITEILTGNIEKSLLE